MYSQCPKCQAIFSVSDADIAAHRGLVRCGHCSGIFHALNNEVDDAALRGGTPGGPGADQAGGGRPPGTDSPVMPEPSGPGQPEPDRAELEEFEPEVSEPAVSEPEVSEPEVSEPEVSEPEVSEPEVSEPEVSEPEVSEPEVSEPEVSEPEVSEPEVSEPEVSEPEVSEPEVSEPEVSEPEVYEPEVYEPEVYEPEVSEPEVSEPEVSEPEVSEPEVSEPEVSEPEVSEPEVSESEVSEPEVSRPDAPASVREDKRPAEEGPDLPGEIVEEITIEAPPVLWNVFDEEADEARETGAAWQASVETFNNDQAAPPGAAPASRSGWGGHAPPPADPEAGPAAPAPGMRTPLRSPRRGSDVRMVELPQPRPFKTASLSLLTVLLALLLVWQVKSFYLDELAQVPVLRPYLESLCRPLGCAVPPRRDFAQVDLVGTSIDVNPQVPGALAITASLINRAHFPQPYPPLRVTLTDREGRVVGRRTYLPAEYLAQDAGDLLPIREPRDVTINLARPAENAVGYEIELMAPASGDE